MNNAVDLINAVEDNNDDEEVKPVEPLRRSPRIPIPNKRYEEEEQEPEQEIIKPIPVKTKKSNLLNPLNPLNHYDVHQELQYQTKDMFNNSICLKCYMILYYY